MKFEGIYIKCQCKLSEISKLNEYFEKSFEREIDKNEEFDGNFFSSYRKSTDILYRTLK